MNESNCAASRIWCNYFSSPPENVCKSRSFVGDPPRWIEGPCCECDNSCGKHNPFSSPIHLSLFEKISFFFALVHTKNRKTAADCTVNESNCAIARIWCNYFSSPPENACKSRSFVGDAPRWIEGPCCLCDNSCGNLSLLAVFFLRWCIKNN